MKVYVDANDIGKTITYKEENGVRQHLYVHDKEGFIFKDLSDYTKQVRKEVCEEIGNKLKENGLLYTWKGVPKYKAMEELLDQIQGETE